ncbi:MAG: hypothetical protein JOZ19_12350 [Rubrobacter sp.]|nr:hypothetical protein [Rubrobacter sp.]
MASQANQYFVGSIPLPHKLPNVHHAPVMFLRGRIIVDFSRPLDADELKRHCERRA